MFEVTYSLKGIKYVMSYKVEAVNADEARRIADRYVGVECNGAAVKKVTVKSVAA
jgi:DNA topoisomerase IA